MTGCSARGLADLRRMPSTLIDEGTQCTVHRYHPAETAPRRRRAGAPPVLLVPPLAAPATTWRILDEFVDALGPATRRARKPKPRSAAA